MEPKRSDISVSGDNRLVITEIYGKKYPLSLPGKPGFDSSVEYETDIEEISGKRKVRKVTLEGTWDLHDNGLLAFRVSGTDSPYSGKTIRLKGAIEKAEGTKLVFNARECETLKNFRSRTVALSGNWCADKMNRLNFLVRKLTGRNDLLVLQGGWELNGSNEVIYRYSEEQLKTKIKKDRRLTFKGHWVFARNRLIYQLEASESLFAFRARLLSKTLRNKDKSIKYALAIGYRKKSRIIKKTVKLSISGTWKIDKGLNVGFEVKYSPLKVMTAGFNIKKIVREQKKMVISLSSSLDGSIMMDLVVSGVMTDDPVFFLSMSKYAREHRIMAGFRIKF